jgi:hypothetical protein
VTPENSEDGPAAVPPFPAQGDGLAEDEVDVDFDVDSVDSTPQKQLERHDDTATAQTDAAPRAPSATALPPTS